MSRIEKAMAFARDAHKGQIRKNSNQPYIIHPIEVAEIIAEYEINHEDLIIAALLHDVVEDTEHTLEEIQEEFGADVARYVRDVTDLDKSLSWKTRKKNKIKHIRAASFDSKLLSAADKISNMRAFVQSIHEIGVIETFKPFHSSYEDQLWYQKQMYDATMTGLNLYRIEHPILILLKKTLTDFETVIEYTADHIS